MSRHDPQTIKMIIPPKLPKYMMNRKRKLDLHNPPPDLGLMIMKELTGFDELSSTKNPYAQAPFGTRALKRRQRASVAETARILGIPASAVNKIAKAFVAGGQAAVDRLRWGSGRPVKNLFFT